MEDDIPSPKSDDPLAMLARQDLDPLSLDELDERIAALHKEIERSQAHKARASKHRDAAEALFGKKS